MLQAKERARDQLARRYRSRALDEEEILHCLYSISDNNVSADACLLLADAAASAVRLWSCVLADVALLVGVAAGLLAV